MSFESMSSEAVAEEIGRRIEQLRLERNLTQQQIADEVGLSRLSYRRLEAGEAKLINVIAVLRVLGQLEVLERAIPDVIFSPMEQLKLLGKKRKRASGSRLINKKSKPYSVDEVTEDLDW
jgi:transcriptional regulator with XRE-family HTH domain